MPGMNDRTKDSGCDKTRPHFFLPSHVSLPTPPPPLSSRPPARRQMLTWDHAVVHRRDVRSKSAVAPRGGTVVGPVPLVLGVVDRFLRAIAITPVIAFRLHWCWGGLGNGGGGGCRLRGRGRWLDRGLRGLGNRGRGGCGDRLDRGWGGRCGDGLDDRLRAQEAVQAECVEAT